MKNKRLTLNKTIFYKKFYEGFYFKDINIELLPDDYLDVEETDQGDLLVSITRYVEETDDELKERLKFEKEQKLSIKNSQEILKKIRYEQYLKLKEEFENEKPD